MTDSFFFGISQAVLLILLTYFYMLAVTRLLPAKWLRPMFPASKHDRGLKKNVFAGGRSVTYKPRLALRKYMSGYVLFCEGGRKYIKCKIGQNIKEIKYSVTIFNRKNDAVGTLDITEKTNGSGYTQTVNLPDETSFVQMSVLGVDGKDMEKSVASYYNARNIAVYAAVTVLCTVIMAVLYNVAIYDLLNQTVFYTDETPSLAMAFVFGLCFGVINTGILLLLNLSGNAKITMPKE